MNDAARFRGLKNRAAGKGFEKRLQDSFDLCRKHGTALIDKTPEPFRIINRQEGGKFVGCFERKAQPDYKGTIKGGISVMIEAKYTGTDRIRQEVVSKDQTKYLSDYAALGAHCFVIVGFSSGSAYMIPFEIWIQMSDFFGRKYATEKDLEPYRIKTHPNGLFAFFGG